MKKLLGGLCLLCVMSSGAWAQQLETRVVSSNNTYSTALVTEKTDYRIGWVSDETVPNGQIQVLFYASESASVRSDGSPDFNSFDFGGVTATCPTSIAGVFDFGPAQVRTAVVANQYYYNGYYHVVTCPYTGTGDASQANFGYSNNNPIYVNQVINPQNDPTLPDSQLIYSPIWVRQLDGSGQMSRNQLITVTSSRNVQMLATVSPQISFSLVGLPGGQTFCGVNNRYNTTGAVADFGVITDNSLTDIAQRLLVSTNAINGYVVTAQMDDQMRIQTGGAVVCSGEGVGNDACLPSAQVAGMTSALPASWTNIAQGQGLAFTMENVTGGDNLFDYTDGYRHFADHEASESPVPIMQTPAGLVSSNNICYRLAATATNIDGVYTNQLTYTITANF